MRTRPITFETGIAGLDIVLGGGLSRDALIFLVGMSGAGKTVLGAQLLFNAARRGERSVILTGLSEGHVKLLEHLSAFSFFDSAFVGVELTLLSLQTIIGQDLEAAAAALIRIARQSDARVMLIDGLHTLRTLLPSPEHVMFLLAALANQLTYLGVTLIVTVNGPPEQIHAMPEIIMADVAISMDYSTSGWQRIRRLEVIKHRGHAQLGGAHTFVVTPAGITLYPRLEVLDIPVESATTEIRTRSAFGITELDHILQGGLAASTSTFIVGAIGTGKTALALHWAHESATPSAPTLLISFRETTERLQQRAATFGLDITTALDQVALTILYISPTDVDPDRVGNQLLSMLQTTSIRRVVIDDLTALTHVLRERTDDYIAALHAWFRYFDVTVVSTLLVSSHDATGLTGTQAALLPLAENIILLQQHVEAHRLRRVLVVQKSTLPVNDSTVREIVLDGNGFRLLPAPPSAASSSS